MISNDSTIRRDPEPRYTKERERERGANRARRIKHIQVELNFPRVYFLRR